MFTFLDTETKALLQHVPPEKLAPPDTGTFTLVLLGKERQAITARVEEVLSKVPGVSPLRATTLAFLTTYVRVAKGLSLTDALLWQFELICCDAISIFLSDEVASSAPQAYLMQLYSQLRKSPEFEPVHIAVTAIPNTDMGKRFVSQFLQDRNGMLYQLGGTQGTYESEVTRKKARIMAHWAKKIGAKVTVDGDN